MRYPALILAVLLLAVSLVGPVVSQTPPTGQRPIRVVSVNAAGSPAPLNVSLPASSPVVVAGALPAGSPVGVLPSLPVVGRDADGLKVQGPVAHAAAASSNPVRIGARVIGSSAIPNVADGNTCDLGCDQQGNLKIIDIKSATQTGYDVYRTVALTNVSLQAKSSAGIVGSIILGNPNSANSWVNLYDTANASVTVGTTTPVATYMVAANSTLVVPGPVTHATAICLSAGSALSGTAAPTNNLTATVQYK